MKALALFLLVACLHVSFPSSAGESLPGCAGAPDFCMEELDRIESAYAAGLEKAGDADETVRCLRIRNASLAALVERGYESTLALLAERPDMAAALEKDQAVWREDFELLSPSSSDDAPLGRVALEAASQMLLGRLRLFGTISAALNSPSVVEMF